MRKRNGALGRWLALAWVCISGPLSATEYSVIELNMGGVMTEARAINDSGAVAGMGANASGLPRAFRYKNGNLQELMFNPSGIAQGYAINKNDKVAGLAHSDNFKFTAYLWDSNNVATSTGYLPDAVTFPYSYAYGVNDNDEVVGFSSTTVPFFTLHAYHWKNGVLTDLGTLGGSHATAWAINNKGQIVGEAGPVTSTTSNDLRKPVLWDHGTVTCLCPGGADMEGGIAYAINEAGQIVGDCYETYSDGTQERHAVVWDNGNMTEIGALGGDASDAWGNNEAGEVVGWAETATGVQHAFFWKNGVMTDLNSLLPVNSGWELTVAYDINNLGQIVGAGTFNGASRGFILNPASTPTKPARGDFNADRKTDILLRHPSSGQVTLWLMD